MKKATIVIDFDGIIVIDKYPQIGKVKRMAKVVINKLAKEHTIIINTCRAGKFEDEARVALDEAGIEYHYFNENSKELIDKYGGDCRKISGDIYIDDKSLDYKFMNWEQIEKKIYEKLAQKPIIITITGESGTGKSLLADYLEKQYDIGMIESYTTRPRRFEGETGHTFISNEEYDQLDEIDMIAFTKFGDHRYCCLKKDIKAINTYIIDERGLEYLEDNFGYDYDIIKLRVVRDEDKRNVSDERKKRDEGMFDRKIWCITIENNRSKEHFFISIDAIISNYFATYYGVLL